MSALVEVMTWHGRQPTIWTNGSQTYWHIYAPFGLEELMYEHSRVFGHCVALRCAQSMVWIYIVTPIIEFIKYQFSLWCTHGEVTTTRISKWVTFLWHAHKIWWFSQRFIFHCVSSQGPLNNDGLVVKEMAVLGDLITDSEMGNMRS